MARPTKPRAERLQKRSVTMTDAKYERCVAAVESLGKRLGLRLNFSSWAGEVLHKKAEDILREEFEQPVKPGRR